MAAHALALVILAGAARTSPGAPGNPLLTVAQAAERLGVGERFVRRLIAEKRITVYRIGGRHVRLAEADVASFIRAGRSEPEEAPKR